MSLKGIHSLGNMVSVNSFYSIGQDTQALEPNHIGTSPPGPEIQHKEMTRRVRLKDHARRATG